MTKNVTSTCCCSAADKEAKATIKKLTAENVKLNKALASATAKLAKTSESAATKLAKAQETIAKLKDTIAALKAKKK